MFGKFDQAVEAERKRLANVAEAERLLDLADDMKPGQQRWDTLAMACMHLRAAGSHGYARAVHNVIIRESEAAAEAEWASILAPPSNDDLWAYGP